MVKGSFYLDVVHLHYRFIVVQLYRKNVVIISVQFLYYRHRSS